jgi:flagellin
MSRINTNVTSLIASRVLNTNNASLNTSLERLSTGLRINSGKDDPAGLIASENLRNQISGTEAAIKNAQRADTIIATAEGSLTEVSSLLNDLQGLLTEVANAGGMSDDEINANQMQVDSILNSIDRIANSTEFEGMKLLNGDKNYTSSVGTPANVTDYQINAAKLIDGASMAAVISVGTVADQGTLTLVGTTTEQTTIQVSSNRGTTELTFATGTTAANIGTAIDAVKEVTGVSAAAAVLTSVDYGADAFVTVDITSGGAGITGGTGTDYGTDIVATVNGVAATGKGKVLNIRTSMLDIEVDMSAAGMAAGGDTITISGGGADFALGAKVDAIGLESIGIPNIASGQLGNATDGRLSSLRSGGTNSLDSTNLYTAQNILTEATKDISRLRGRLGSFQKNTLQSTINSLNVTNENLQSAESAIRDTDFATETSKLTRSQILVQAATSVLAQANYAPQGVLNLLS